MTNDDHATSNGPPRCTIHNGFEPSCVICALCADYKRHREPARFRVGQWLRYSGERERVGRITDWFSDEKLVLDFIDAPGKRYAIPGRMVAEWTPRRGERLRWRSLTGTGWATGSYVERREFHIIQSAFVQIKVPLETEFEPVFDEPPIYQSLGVTALPDPAAATATDALKRLDAKLTEHNRRVSKIIGGRDTRDERYVSRGSISTAHLTPADCDRIVDELRAACGHERTHPTLAPRADRYAARKAEARAVLSGSWKGKR